MRISDWSSDVCSSDLLAAQARQRRRQIPVLEGRTVPQRSGLAGQHRQIMTRVIDRAVAPEVAGMLGDNLLAAAHDNAVGVGPDLHRPPRQRRENRVAVAIEADQAGASHRMLALRSEEHTSELQSLMRISYAVF